MSPSNHDPDTPSTADDAESLDFIRTKVQQDVAAGKNDGRVATRFPPEPNGYLHIGHAKAICLNFGLAEEFGGTCNLRFDDTNPITEDTEFVDAIQDDIRWLGFEWDQLHYASDYFEQLYDWAIHLIREGKAYVDSLDAEQAREYRGSWNEPGRNSPFRDRSVEENLDLLTRMRAGEFPDGAHTVRAKIDMSAGNMNMRDPILYRIRHAHHHRTSDDWCIYPSYDFTHGQSDAIEGITHSLCSLEFEDHRPLYNWFLDNLPVPNRPEQTEFARLNLSYTVLSKRKLLQLVEQGHVNGWSDPRMPTLSGYRRRGFTPESIRDFCNRIGMTKNDSVTDLGLLEYSIRDHLNRIALRRMAVLNPIKVVIENFPEDGSDDLEAINNPENESDGTRTVAFTRELYIEREDFMEDPPKKFFRLAPGREVRLRYAYFITCTDVIKDEAGEVVELRCSYDPATRGGDAPDGRKVKATLHWVSAKHAIPFEARLYDRLFSHKTPGSGDRDFLDDLNPESLEVRNTAWGEPSLAEARVGEHYQFERLGYFAVDHDSSDSNLVFNRTVTLRDSWAKIERQTAGQKKQ